jgi:endo-1,4-beta-xylanase
MVKHLQKRLVAKGTSKFLRFSGWGLVLTGVVGLALFLATGPSNALPSPGKPVDLITGQDWSHFAGAYQTDNGIQIQPLGRAIVNQDGTDNQTNPPVNVRGPHLSFNSDLQVSFRASQIPAQGAASFYLYGSPPIIYDEWRYQPPQLRIDLNQQKVTVYGWNGKSDSPSFSKSWPLPVGTGAYVELNLSKQKGAGSLLVNGVSLKGWKNQKLFKNGNIWFGADNSVGNSEWTLKSLTAGYLKGNLNLFIPSRMFTAFRRLTI